MLEIQLDQVKKFTRVLDGMGAKYKIVLSDGTAFGDLEVASKRTRKRAPLYPYGSVRRQFKGIVDGLTVGKAAVIDGAHFDLNMLASNITAYSIGKWGKGAVSTKLMRDHNKVQVVRLG